MWGRCSCEDIPIAPECASVPYDWQPTCTGTLDSVLAVRAPASDEAACRTAFADWVKCVAAVGEPAPSPPCPTEAEKLDAACLGETHVCSAP